MHECWKISISVLCTARTLAHDFTADRRVYCTFKAQLLDRNKGRRKMSLIPLNSFECLLNVMTASLACKDQKPARETSRDNTSSPVILNNSLFLYFLGTTETSIALCSLSHCLPFNLQSSVPTQLNSCLTQLKLGCNSRFSEMPKTMDKCPNSLSICANLETLPGRHSAIKN